VEFDSQHRWAAGVVFWRALGIDSPSFLQTTPPNPTREAQAPFQAPGRLEMPARARKGARFVPPEGRFHAGRKGFLNQGEVCSWWLILLYGRPGKSQISRRMKVDLNSGVKSQRHLYINYGGTEDTEDTERKARGFFFVEYGPSWANSV
jgi:hypothetical protein